jgi:hypothetical protein
MTELIIGDDTYIPPSMMDGTFGRGLVPRDMASFPVGSFAPPADIKLIPRSEWSERIKEMESNKSRLSDIRMRGDAGRMIPSLNQTDVPYCWSHGPVAAVILMRAVMNLPYVPLSAYGVGYTIKRGAMEGAWGALAVDFIKDRGIPTAADWPHKSARMRPDSDPIWQKAKEYRITQGWVELQAPVYDRDLSFDQVMTCLLNRIPVCADFNFWGHHVVLLDPVEVSPGQFGVRLWNSWGDQWENNGMAVLTGRKAIPDNATAPSVVVAS